MERARIASFVVLVLALAAWVLALGGLGSINANACGTDVSNPIAIAKCSRKWSWEWWALFLELFVIISAAVVSCLPAKRLAVGRHIIAHFFTIATAILMVACNGVINVYVWPAFDVAPMFNDHTGADKVDYMSGAAVVAGWICCIIFNFAWIAAVLGHTIKADGCCGGKKKPTGGPIVGAVTGAENVSVEVRN